MQIRTIVCILHFFIPLSFYALFEHTAKPQKKIIIMPAGDAHTIGRYIGDNVERSITLHCGQKMKSYIEAQDTTVTVYLTRKAGEVVPFLQNAHLANCLDVDLALSLHFYQETEARPHFFIYTYKDSVSFIAPSSHLMFYPYYHAYLFNQEKTNQFVRRFVHNFSNSAYKTLFTIHQPIAFPALPLVGIVPISFIVEIGIDDEHGYETVIQPLCDILLKTMKE